MEFCNDNEIDTSEILDLFSEFHDRITELYAANTMQAIALAYKFVEYYQKLIDKMRQLTLKSIICKILSEYKLDDYVEKANNYIEDYFDEFKKFEDTINELENRDFQSLDDVENALSPYFDDFLIKKDDIEKYLNDALKVVFEPLVKIGARQEDIDKALEDVEFNDNPVQYIEDVFYKIGELSLQHLENDSSW